jgi:hypothetical protein
MKKFITLLNIILFAFISQAQNVPIDFETGGNGADWNWATFENDTNPALEIIANPDPSGINTSSTVAKFTAMAGGQPHAGCETEQGAGIGTWTIDQSNSTIRIMVWKSVISDVGIKLVQSDFGSLGEIKVPNTKTEEWELLEFDFSAHIGKEYTQIVVFPDFQTRSADNIVYFDNLYGEATATGSIANKLESTVNIFPNPAQNTLKISSQNALNEVAIYSLEGRLIKQLENGIRDVTIDIAELAKGTYILKATSDNTSLTKRFVKQ